MTYPQQPTPPEQGAWTPPPPGYTPPQTPKPETPRWAKIAAVAIVGVVGLAIAIAVVTHKDNPKTGGPAFVAPTTHAIVYLLTGTATGADITISTGGGGQSQQQGVDVPLTSTTGTPGIRFTANSGDFLYISAQNTGGGDLTCSITEDGTVVSTNTSSGEFAIATCQGTA